MGKYAQLGPYLRLLDRVRSPSQITSSQNNYDPGRGIFYRISTDASRNITGILAGTTGDEIQIANVGSNNLVLTNQDSASSAANRIITGIGSNLTLTPDQGAIIRYDGTTQRWRVIAVTTTPGGSGTVTSVALTMPSEFSVAGSPITTSGTLAVSKANQSANIVFAGPTSGGAAAPTFRSLVVADLPSIPTARAFHNADQSISNATVAALAFNSENFDTDTIHDTSTNNSRLTCKTAGQYAVFGNVRWAANGTGQRQTRVRLNGGAYITSSILIPSASADLVQNVDTIYSFSVNDYIEIVVYQDSGGSLNVVYPSSDESPSFGMFRIGP